MRGRTGVWALLLCMSAVMVAEADGPSALSPAMLRALKAGLSPAARQSLARTITPREQLEAVQTNPALARRFQRIGLRRSTDPAPDPVWIAGLTLTPLAATYPVGGDYGNFNLALTTQAAYLSQITPLPTAAQNPPVLWLNVDDNNATLMSIEAKWPRQGVYLVSIFLRDVWPNPTLKPRVFVGSQALEVVPDPQTGLEPWTVACWVDDPQDLYDEIRVCPVASGLNFRLCCVSKVVVSQFWLD